MSRSRIDLPAEDARYLSRVAAAERRASQTAQDRRDDLADALRTLSEDEGYSVRVLAEAVGLSPSHVHRLMKAKP
jgi:AraC-like DNA-binding protein